MNKPIAKSSITRISAVLVLIAGLSVTPSHDTHAEDDPADLAFEQGNVLVICGKPVTGGELTSDAFFEGFGEWITLLQEKANAGVIARAHYLDNLKDGVFIVFEGPDRALAQQRADEVIDELTTIYRDIEGVTDIEICRSHQIGPIAAFPR
ncbi:MAG: hypothetical protein AAGA33_06880 [Pseudomonadota bacterium]